MTKNNAAMTALKANVTGKVESGEAVAIVEQTAPVLTEAAAAIIKADVAAFKRDRKRYSDYVAEMEVSAETVADHVALFREAYKAASPKAHADEVRAYATKVRNGLNYWVGKALSNEDTETDWLAKILKDVDAAVKADLDKTDILQAVNLHLESL